MGCSNSKPGRISTKFSKRIHRQKLTSFDELPADIRQQIIKKTVVTMFQSLRQTRFPDNGLFVEILSSLAKVSSFCHQTVSSWPRQDIRRIQRWCRPYLRHFRESGRLEASGSARGVAQVDGRIFVVSFMSDNIDVYSSTSPYHKLDQIHVEGLQRPNDLVACRQTHCLYVADWTNNFRLSSNDCVWRAQAVDDEGSSVKCWISGTYEVEPNDNEVDGGTRKISPHSLSLSSHGRLLVVSSHSALLVYTPDGSRVYRVCLPDFMWASHAVELSADSDSSTPPTFAVCHSSRAGHEADHEQVSTVDSEGHVLRTFGSLLGGGVSRLALPQYLVALPGGCLLVADYGNHRVMALNSQLQRESDVITKNRNKLDRPMCIRLSANSDRLLVRDFSGRIIFFKTRFA